MAWNWQQALSGAGSGAAVGTAIMPGWGTAAGAGAGALMGLLGNGDKPMSPELEALFNQQVTRLQDTNPLYESVMRLAFDRLPTAAKSGLSVPSWSDAAMSARGSGGQGRDPGPDGTYTGDVAVPRTGGLPGGGVGAGDGGDFSQPPAVRALMRQQMIRQTMAAPIIQAITRLAQSRMPKGYTMPTHPGNG